METAGRLKAGLVDRSKNARGGESEGIGVNENRKSGRSKSVNDGGGWSGEDGTCPECGSPRLVTDHSRGEVFCQDCGIVVEDARLDYGPEWRSYDSERGMQRARAGPPVVLTLHDKGFTTTIGNDRDSHGNPLSPKTRIQFTRLRKWQSKIRTNSSAERNLVRSLMELERITSSLGLPKSITERAALIYRRVVSNNLTRGRCIDSIVAAAVYAACREAGLPRTLDEVAAHSSVDKRSVGRAYRFLARTLGLKPAPITSTDYVPKICAALGVSGEVQERALEIVNEAEKSMVSRSPAGVAAAAVYIASILLGERRTQREVAGVAGVTEVTIRNCYKMITDRLGIELLL
ncbi:Transcription factor TFIIB cyclin-related protein [Ferroglobus placidus DSM 10642]|uniref:Transcription initiation factor IIB n=1 Tax=Ferroglobus placidus (strain DSM 10642 / AEDII12DO) TaxID=589924 RepID=D3S395_FERPA|nr:transcription initiation factor IIB [Ferroglobus placidus]ADC64728.1 Transcription factor TFIIB cyclin-related protein [Ferroglobus placidus DSM 10642]